MKFRTILFYIYFIIMCFFFTLYGIILLPFSYHAMGKGVIVWGDLIRFGLRKMCNIDFEVRGIEYLPKDRPVIIACKHQSTFETVGLFFKYLPSPVYVLKADLDKIPLWCIIREKAGGLAVERSKGGVALRKMLDEAKIFIEQGRSLIVFPEGTRTEAGKEGRYHSGVYGLAQAFKNDVIVIPVALNSGMFWPKGKKMHPGKVILEFMPPLAGGLDKKEFMATLKETIENKTRLLEEEARKSSKVNC